MQQVAFGVKTVYILYKSCINRPFYAEQGNMYATPTAVSFYFEYFQ